MPNITPNGVIVAKKEVLKSYLDVQKLIIKLLTKYHIYPILSDIQLCDVRLMRSDKHNYNDKRPYSSTYIHADVWSGNPYDSKMMLFIDGDTNNTVEFYKVKSIDKNFFQKKQNYKNQTKKYQITKIKRFDSKKITIFDKECLHKTVNKNCNLRLSIDCGFIYKSKNKKLIENRFQKNLINKHTNLSLSLLNQKLLPKSIHEKF